MKLKSILLTAVALIGLTATTMAQVPNYLPTNGLVAWYPFNGNANDESGNVNNGTVNGASLTLDRLGNPNTAYNLNNVGSKIDLLSTNSYLGSSNFTISFWFKSLSNGDDQYVLSKRPSCLGGGEHFIEFRITPTGNNIIAGTTFEHTSPSSAFTPNIWNHFIYSRNGSNYSIYLNGILTVNGNYPIDISPNAVLGVSSTTACIANFGQDNKRFIGDIDDIGIWDRALTQQEITDLYNSSSCYNDLVINPQNNTSQTGGSVSFTATTSDPNPNFVWQSDFGQGFQTLNNFGNYSGVNTNTLSINNLQLANHLQQFRAISTSGNCIDTSNVATITLTDTCINYITVTDTLIINTTLSVLSPPNNVNTIKVYPNPASTHITIDYGDYTLMNGYTLQIVNTLGQTVYTTPINQQSSYIDLTTWTGNGLYFVQIIDPQSNVIENRKIIIQ